MRSKIGNSHGGGNHAAKSPDNHLARWIEKERGTKSGREGLESGERYLPEAARESLSQEDYARTTAKKRKDMPAGKQFSAQPKDVAEKTGGVPGARRRERRSRGE